MSQHLGCVAKNEPWIVSKSDGHMAEFHPAICVPSNIFHLIGSNVFAANDGGCAVVFFKSLINDQIALAQVLGHRRARVRSGVLDVWPVDMSACEVQVGLDRID